MATENNQVSHAESSAVTPMISPISTPIVTPVSSPKSLLINSANTESVNKNEENSNQSLWTMVGFSVSTVLTVGLGYYLYRRYIK